VEIESGGLTRSFRLAVPSSYDATHAVPLVFDFHGVLSNADEEAPRSGLSDAGERDGFITVTPNGYHQSWNAESCCGDAMRDHVDDLGFVRDMVASLEAEYCIDPQRIYAAGYSNGGLFSFFLACRASDLVAAISSIEAASPTGSACQPERPVPILAFNGTGDPIVPYVVAAPTMAAWREIDGCSHASSITYSKGDSSCESWSDCADGSETVLCTIQGGGHVWPGGGDFPSFLGKKTLDISATEKSVEFFAAHPKP
jgi:polyhydroxybutyrate depolymerase